MNLPPSTLQSRIRACLLGGAIGDALGAPVEFLNWTQIQKRFGPGGITGYAPAYGRTRGAITDDTQMTLFTAEGLLRGIVRERLRGMCSFPSIVCHAYQRWLLTQQDPSATTKATAEPGHAKLEVGRDGWLWGVQELHSRRAPGNTCLSALAAMKHFTDERAPNDSKGAGAIMRVAPVALLLHNGSEEQAAIVFDLAKSISWITHGHPSGYLSAAAFAVILHARLWGLSLHDGIHRAYAFLRPHAGDADETLNAMRRSIGLAQEGLPPQEAIPQIGPAWVGEEALGVALYCALTAPDFGAAVLAAVNHGGDSDTTGSLVGQLMGAALGEDALPPRWLRDLELRDTITAIADDLAGFRSWELTSYGGSPEVEEFTKRIFNRYPGW